MPTASPMPMIGPISGDMSMAPIITAVEFTLSPSDAMNIAKTRTHSVAPWNDTPALILRIVSSSFSLSGMALKYFFQKTCSHLSCLVNGFGFAVAVSHSLVVV